jgi:hypothetical protein
MLFYTGLIVAIFGLSILEIRVDALNVKKWIKYVIKVIPFIILFVLNTFKAETVGYDALAYHYWYTDLVNGIRPSGSYPSVEIGFKFVIELFAKTKAPYLVFYAIMNFIVYSTTGFAIIKLSKNSCLSTLVYCCLSVMVLNFSALRQSLALGIVFLSVYFLVKKKLWAYIVFGALVIIAGLFHKSAYVFLICIPFVYLKIKPKHLIYLTPFIVLFFFLVPYIFQTIYYFSGSLTYMPTYRKGVGEYYFIFFAIYCLFLLLSTKNIVSTKVFYLIDKLKQKLFKKQPVEIEDYQPEIDEKTNVYLGLFLVGVLFQATSRVNYAAPRLATQFLMLSALFVPNTLLTIRNTKFKYFMIIMASICFYAFFVYDSILPNYLGVNPYHFL